jgi:hypothetical protein
MASMELVRYVHQVEPVMDLAIFFQLQRMDTGEIHSIQMFY